LVLPSLTSPATQDLQFKDHCLTQLLEENIELPKRKEQVGFSEEQAQFEGEPTEISAAGDCHVGRSTTDTRRRSLRMMMMVRR